MFARLRIVPALDLEGLVLTSSQLNCRYLELGPHRVQRVFYEGCLMHLEPHTVLVAVEDEERVALAKPPISVHELLARPLPLHHEVILSHLVALDDDVARQLLPLVLDLQCLHLAFGAHQFPDGRVGKTNHVIVVGLVVVPHFKAQVLDFFEDVEELEVGFEIGVGVILDDFRLSEATLFSIRSFPIEQLQ